MMLEGFTSRWSTPWRWASARAASTHCPSVSTSGSADAAARRAAPPASLRGCRASPGRAGLPPRPGGSMGTTKRLRSSEQHRGLVLQPLPRGGHHGPGGRHLDDDPRSRCAGRSPARSRCRGPSSAAGAARSGSPAAARGGDLQGQRPAVESRLPFTVLALPAHRRGDAALRRPQTTLVPEGAVPRGGKSHPWPPPRRCKANTRTDPPLPGVHCPRVPGQQPGRHEEPLWTGIAPTIRTDGRGAVA